MTEHYSFYAKVTAFFKSYLGIPENNYYYGQDKNLTKQGIRTCANHLIGVGVFTDKNDMKTQALKDFNIILPDWVFEDGKEVIPNER